MTWDIFAPFTLVCPPQLVGWDVLKWKQCWVLFATKWPIHRDSLWYNVRWITAKEISKLFGTSCRTNASRPQLPVRRYLDLASPNPCPQTQSERPYAGNLKRPFKVGERWSCENYSKKIWYRWLTIKDISFGASNSWISKATKPLLPTGASNHPKKSKDRRRPMRLLTNLTLK